VFQESQTQAKSNELPKTAVFSLSFHDSTVAPLLCCKHLQMNHNISETERKRFVLDFECMQPAKYRMTCSRGIGLTSESAQFPS